MTSPQSINSHLEQRFENLWYSLALDLTLVPQKSGVVPGRRYVYDFYCPQANALFEIQGGTYARGRSGHTSGKGIARDADKVNQAQIQGYLIFVLTTDQLNKEYVNQLVNYCRGKQCTNY